MKMSHTHISTLILGPLFLLRLCWDPSPHPPFFWMGVKKKFVWNKNITHPYQPQLPLVAVRHVNPNPKTPVFVKVMLGSLTTPPLFFWMGFKNKFMLGLYYTFILLYNMARCMLQKRTGRQMSVYISFLLVEKIFEKQFLKWGFVFVFILFIY